MKSLSLYIVYVIRFDVGIKRNAYRRWERYKWNCNHSTDVGKDF